MAILPLSTAAGLVVYILAGISLPLAILLLLAVGLAVAILIWRKTPTHTRPALKRRFTCGLVAGICATLAYDLSRYLLVSSGNFSFSPFHVFSIFGRLIIGESASPTTALIVGTGYHISNGVGLGVAYLFIFPRPGIWTALLWSAVLELFMISLYPSWLNLKALDELASISIFGHLFYGLALGAVARRMLYKQDNHLRETVMS